MRTITLIIIHCSATRQDRRFTFEQCREDHIRHRRFKDIGYHYYIEIDGTIHKGRDESVVGAHCKNHNAHSIGICYEGGAPPQPSPYGEGAAVPPMAKDTRTPEQKAALHALLVELKRSYPRALILGHHDLNPQKACPCFDAASEYKNL